MEQSLTINEWISDEKIDQLRVRAREDRDTVVLIPRDFVFSCRGTIEQWSLHWLHRYAFCPTVSFTFYVLRESEECNLQVVGMNTFTATVSQSSSSDVQNAKSTFTVNPE